MSEYGDIVDGLHSAFATVDYLHSDHLLKYEPGALHETPAVYSLFESREGRERGQLVVTEYRTLHRFCAKTADPKAAEALIYKAVYDLPAAVEADPRLGGAISKGRADCYAGRGGFINIGGTVYRIVEFTSTAIVKRGKL